MLWFIFWCVLILAAILSVPIVAMMENKKRLAEVGPMTEEPADEAGEEGEGMAEPSEEVVEPVAEEGQAEFEDVGDDAFADFK